LAAVNLEKLWKRYGKNAAVQDINLAIRDGEFVSLLGPSGCGKTSTMRMVAGLEQISEGHIYFDGDPVDALPPSQRKVAMAFENYALYPTLDVFENLAFPMRAQGWKQADIERRVREVAGIMRLTEILAQKVTNLSNGQQQAVGLARALTRHPNVLLLDEPISHLDTGHRTNMRAYLKRLHVDLGYTMIYVTHDQEEAMAMSDRIAVMDGGRIIQVGTAAEIYGHPADTFVAGFIGEPAMNLLDCDREGDVLRLNGANVPIPEHYMRAAGAIPRELVLGIRPFFIDVADVADAKHGVPVTVFVFEALGDMTLITARLADSIVLVAQPPAFRAKPGDQLWLGFAPSHIQLFDKKTGKAVAT
jgi:multiple sugar transport system ATP-binding protein